MNVFFKKFSGIDTTNEDLYTTSLIPDFKIFMILKSKLDNKIVNTEIRTNVRSENFCCVLFFKKADRIAIIKSSLLEAITLNIQST